MQSSEKFIVSQHIHVIWSKVIWCNGMHGLNCDYNELILFLSRGRRAARNFSLRPHQNKNVLKTKLDDTSCAIVLPMIVHVEVETRCHSDVVACNFTWITIRYKRRDRFIKLCTIILWIARVRRCNENRIANKRYISYQIYLKGNVPIFQCV